MMNKEKLKSTKYFKTAIAVFFLSLLSSASESFSQELTYNKDISPVFLKNCVPCHKNGEATPFTLTTYEDVVSRSSIISKAIQEKVMPPWPADTGYTRFCNERFLSDNEIKLVV